MAAQRFEHLVTEVTAKLMTDPKERIQSDMDRLGAEGWELVAVTQSHQMSPLLLFFKRPV